MTKRANKETTLAAALIGIPSAIGAAAGGVAGHYGSDEPNNTPATVLGALGGGAGTATGLWAGIHYLDGLNIALNNTNVNSKWLSMLNDYVREINKNPKQALPDHPELLKSIAALEKQLAKTPKWMKYIAKHPKLHNALMLGGLGLSTSAGGALGAELGTALGDKLAD